MNSSPFIIHPLYIMMLTTLPAFAAHWVFFHFFFKKLNRVASKHSGRIWNLDGSLTILGGFLLYFFMTGFFSTLIATVFFGLKMATEGKL